MGVEVFTDRCGDCGSLDVVTDYSAGDIVCRGCGMILGERIVDDTPEWRNFANDDRGGDPAAKSRVGEAMDARFEDDCGGSYLVDTTSSFKAGSDVASSGGDAPTKHRRPSLKNESAKVRRMHTLVKRIQEVAGAMALPKLILEIALDIYAEAEEKEVSMHGIEKESMPIAVLFIACRKAGHSRSLKELEEASGVPQSRIAKSFGTLKRSLNLEIQQASTEDYVQRFCSRLGLPTKTQMIANDVAKKADSLGLSSGKSPIAVAASVIYLVAAYTNAKRSFEEISHVTKIGEKNVKVVCRELNKNRVILFEGVLLT